MESSEGWFSNYVEAHDCNQSKAIVQQGAKIEQSIQMSNHGHVQRMDIAVDVLENLELQNTWFVFLPSL
jgi:hypothetical protein